MALSKFPISRRSYAKVIILLGIFILFLAIAMIRSCLLTLGQIIQDLNLFFSRDVLRCERYMHSRNMTAESINGQTGMNVHFPHSYQGEHIFPRMPAFKGPDQNAEESINSVQYPPKLSLHLNQSQKYSRRHWPHW